MGTIAKHNKNRRNIIPEKRLNLKGAKYITHTDSVVSAKANFINFYMPMFLSTKQFYYIASRNIVVIEAHPANPAKFVYKDPKTCELDIEKTKWEPFFDHELENAPYAGAFNIQRWINWNLLQPIKGLNTDKIIEQSATGRKYKHFHFDRESALKRAAAPGAKKGGGENQESQSATAASSAKGEEENQQSPSAKTALSAKGEGEKQESQSATAASSAKGEGENQKPQSIPPKTPLNAGCVNPMGAIRSSETQSALNSHLALPGKIFKGADPSQSQIDECAGEALPPSLGPGAETYKSENAPPNLDILKSFAVQNSLRLIQLDSEEGDQFAADIKSSFEKYQKDRPGGKYEADLRSSSFISKFPQKDQKRLRLKLTRFCGGHQLYNRNNQKQHLCSKNILAAFAKNAYSLLEGRHPLFILLDIIRDGKMIGDEDQARLNAMAESCQKTKKDEPCLNLKPYISQAIDYINRNPSFAGRHLFDEALWSGFLSADKQPSFNVAWADSCASVWSRQDSSEACYFRQLKIFYDKTANLNFTKSFSESALLKLGRKMMKTKKIKGDFQNLFQSAETREQNFLKAINIDMDKSALSHLIAQGVQQNSAFLPVTASFAKSLCFFWFDFYLKDYLQKEQMISAFTNYMRKFDYHQVLEQEDGLSYEDKVSFLPDFIDYLLDVENEEGLPKATANTPIA